MCKCGKVMRVLAVVMTILLVGGCAIQFLNSIGSTLELLGDFFEMLGKFLSTFREYHLENAFEIGKYFIQNIFNMGISFTQGSLLYVFYGCILYSLGVIIDKPAKCKSEE